MRIAFVGAGNMARLHLHALRRVRTPHRVVGVQDRDESAGRQFAALARAPSYQTLEALFADAKPELVHVCTPAGLHYEPARLALLGGAHVYVEKPFVATAREADELLDLAARRGLLICAGHQQIRDTAYRALLDQAPDLGDVVQVDSHFTFRPVGTSSERAGATALAEQLVDILPHPLYTLVDALERLAPAPTPGSATVEIGSVVAGARDLHAILRAGESCYGRLSVSLRARPIASFLTVSGTGGTLTADFLRSSVVGAANPGTSPVEKAGNPIVEAGQLAIRNALGVARRVFQGGDYPGLAELIDAFYAAVASGGASPVSPAHLRRVTVLFEELAANVRRAAHAAVQRRPRPSPSSPSRGAAPLVVVTGARGFFGRAITRQLAQRGYRVRGISRSAEFEDPNVHEWLALDLSRSVPAEAFAGAEAVVHAAAASSGDYDAHQRHTLDATRNVLHGMRAAGVSRLVYVSSISVLRPPRTPWEEQNEQTPLTGAADRQFGSYVWGKSGAERIVAAEAGALGIETKVIRPGALVDWAHLEPPGIMGRRLFGRWHLGFGRPGLPIPVCEVGRAAAVIAWTVAQFADAPPVLNLLDPAIATRRRLLEEFRRHGWRGHVAWVPLPLFAGLVHVARYALAATKLRRPAPLALYGILRPRRYNTALSEQVLGEAMRHHPGADVESSASPSPSLAGSPA
ncbi:MAG TPA: Gfo/Idh/MocA family oxidoreductase [Gemmatimonadales bacterium]|nr:Gfo/Idh/MocA family oxidoreductase [Gemmatimonadales bacterium]